MLGINLTRPVATLAVVAGLLAVAGSASAAQTEKPTASPHTGLNLLGYEELEWNVVSQAGPGNDRPNRTQAGILDVVLDTADLVLHTTDLDTKARHDIALNAIRADEHQNTITAAGTPVVGARTGVLA